MAATVAIKAPGALGLAFRNIRKKINVPIPTITVGTCVSLIFPAELHDRPYQTGRFNRRKRWSVWPCVEDIFVASEGSTIYRCIRKPI
jgi:hypothetical protein